MEHGESSGLSVAAFCRGQGISPASYFRWRDRLVQDSSVQDTPGTVPAFIEMGTLGTSRGGDKIELAPAEAIRYNERTAAERSNARLKDELGGNTIMVRGGTKVMCHLMFGVLALSADQSMRLRQ